MNSRNHCAVTEPFTRRRSHYMACRVPFEGGDAALRMSLYGLQTEIHHNLYYKQYTRPLLRRHADGCDLIGG